MKGLFSSDMLQRTLTAVIGFIVGTRTDIEQPEIRLLITALAMAAGFVIAGWIRDRSSDELRDEAAREAERRRQRKRSNFEWDPKRYRDPEDRDQY